MPVGKGHAIIYKDGFMYPQDYHTLLDLFGRENVFEINAGRDVLYEYECLSISPEVVVSEKNFIPPEIPLWKRYGNDGRACTLL